jgi:ferredoxin--NADP+ reductase
VAIIGAGPAGFYAAESLFKTANLVCQIDMFNRFPTPFGLVREGVAPDHQSIKAVTRVYDRIAENPNFRYFGNVTFGSEVTLAELKPLYDQIIYAVGAQSDRKMDIPGENLEGSYPATIFVGWYNGHPDYCELSFDLSHERVVVVGNGNVAMDVARILITPPDILATTDITDYALEALRHSKVREVVMLGRRGPAQAAFTNPELKEFGELPGVDVIVDPQELELDRVSAQALEKDKNAKKNFDTLQAYAAKTDLQGERRLVMRFLVSPVEITGEGGKVSQIKLEKNALVASPDGSLKAKGAGEFETLTAGLVFRSVGYKGIALADVPFNEKSGTIPNVAGRVTESKDGELLPGQYVVGWAKRGPSGIIGTNKPDSAATVKAMVEDLATLSPIADEKRDRSLVEQLLRSKGVDFVTYSDWRKIDKSEISRGEPLGRPRVKYHTVADMLKVCR